MIKPKEDKPHLIRSIVTVPSNNIKWRMVLPGRKQAALVFTDYVEATTAILKPGGRGQEISKSISD